jgi:hypothetical protein
MFGFGQAKAIRGLPLLNIPKTTNCQAIPQCSVIPSDKPHFCGLYETVAIKKLFDSLDINDNEHYQI